MLRAGLIAVVLAVTVAARSDSAYAQTHHPAIGDQVRFLSRGASSWVEGTLLSIESDRWALSLYDGESAGVSLEELVQAEVRVSRRNTLRGALVGAGLGVLVAIAVRSDDSCESGQGEPCDALRDVSGVDDAVLLYLPIFGGGTGALIGTFIQTGKWVPALISTRSPDNLALGLRWRLPLRW